MSRRQAPPVDSSWRMVDGDNDSFDTTYVNPPPDGDEGLYPNTYSFSSSFSPPPTQPFASQPSQLSQVGSSQGSIGDFVARAGADDERVLMRTPFRPTMPPGGPRRVSAGEARAAAMEQYRSPEPEFHMPRVSIDGVPRSPRRARADEGVHGMRRRPAPRVDSERVAKMMREESWMGGGGRAVGSVVAAWLPGMLGEMVAWALGIVGMSFRMAQRPLSLLLAVYLFLGAWTMVQNMVTRSVMVSLQPVCRVPGASYLDLPFCTKVLDPTSPSSFDPSVFGQQPSRQVEFDALMGVQSQFERVLERSAEGVSLPLEMRRSETSIRDLRTLVRHSELPAKEELIHELDGFVGVASRASRDLQRFNTHVGSAVDAVITINRWTARYIDTMAEAQRDLSPGSVAVVSWLPAPLDEWSAWALSPFQPAPIFDERILLDKYVEHTALVSERIASLLVEAQALLGLLTRADDHLQGMHDVVTRQGQKVRSHRDVLSSIWSVFGANRRALESVQAQLDLLGQVGLQRQSAIAQVQAVIYDLEKIQAELADLRDRVAEPAVLRDADNVGRGGIPLSVHIETIGNGVERLDNARKRMRGWEDDRIREVLARGGRVEGERLIEASA